MVSQSVVKAENDNTDTDTIARIEEDRRLPIRIFVQHIDRQPTIQFKENFRMSREAFEVIT